jgi:arylsulfatase A-like enzyme
MKTDQNPQINKQSEVKLEKINGFQASKPNIIIINCDDLGYGDIAAYGGTAIKTPNIDKLAEGGVRFTSFYSCNAVCTPSRFGLLTGRYPKRVGFNWILLSKRNPSTSINQRVSPAYGKFGWALYSLISKLGLLDYGKEPSIKGIPENEITIAQALRSAGYRTGMVGKWHLGEFTLYPEFNPVRHGFDFFYGVPHSNDMRDFALYRNTECLSPNFTGLDKLTGLYTSEALQFIRESEEKPFFLYFAHTYPHQPWDASDRFKGKSAGGRYGDTVEEIDWSVGEVMRLLKERGLIDNTLVIVTSDNGPWYNGSPGKLRGRKGQSYEGGYRIPMIAYWPSRIPAGRICNEPAMNIDWFPTCLALAGLELPGDRIIDGKNIIGLLTGGDDKSPHDSFYFYHNEDLEAVRDGEWKYIPKIHTYVWPVPLDKYWFSSGQEQSPWLYNLETDPNESYNLRDDHADVIEKMDDIFRQWEKQMKENPGGWK